ncbi:MAG: ATP-binding protein [Pirellulales bacterium]
MSVSVAPSIFDVFNARQLTPTEVANSFVPPPHYDALVKPTHTLIVGPRGSGKTTLLKMLHPSALEAWRHPEAPRYRKAIAYSSVFVATDITWNEQIKALGFGRLEPDSHRQFAKAAFTTEILHALIVTMMHRTGRLGGPVVEPHRRLAMTDDQEFVIANQIKTAWNIDSAISTLLGIRLALSLRLSHIHTLASKEALRSSVGRNERLANETFLHLDFLPAAGAAVEVFAAVLRDEETRWALLFDELELAPQWIRAILIKSLRSVDQRFLFKISISPYSVDLKRELEGDYSAGAKQDFEPIKLWYENKEQGYPFCRQLLNRMLDAQQIKNADPVDLFGTSAFATDREEWDNEEGTAYRATSEVGRLYKDLAERDPSFRKYLADRNIGLSTIHTVEGSKRAEHLRKARSIVTLRTYFRRAADEDANQKKQLRRSRKVPTVYGGATSLFAMMEGNPRWFIGIVGELLAKMRGKSVKKPDQVGQVLESADIFRAMLTTIPCGPIGKSSNGLLSLLDPIGEYFAHVAIDAPFDPDPPSSFVVDSDTDDESLRALGMALNAGAIVYAPEEGDVGILDTLVGKRFRLSFILAPFYHFPLLLGRQLKLKEIVRRADVRKRREVPSLFATHEDEDEHA